MKQPDTPSGASPAKVFQPADVRSLRDMAYEDMREAILSGVLPPGQRVKERDVADQMGISTTPVKEALRRLEQEGLVVSQPRRGAVVSGLVQIPVEEIEEIRGALEGIGARLAAERLTEAELQRLGELVTDMTKLTRSMKDPELRVAEVSEFHRIILAASRNDFIVRFVATLTPFERFHSAEYSDPVEAAAILDEHEGIYDALGSRDGGLAQRLMVEHYDRGRAYWRRIDEAEGRLPVGKAHATRSDGRKAPARQRR
jgi:DNA-binding GntR family transcriptional regulator